MQGKKHFIISTANFKNRHLLSNIEENVISKNGLLIKKITCFVVCVVLFLFGIVTLSGCASEEDEAQQALATTLDNFQQGSYEDFINDNVSDFEQFGLDADSFVSSWLDGFNYEITGADYDSDDGVCTVSVTINAKQLVSAITNNLSDIISAISQSYLSGDSTEEIESQLGDLILNALDNEPLTETQIDVGLQKEDDTWQLTAEGQEALTYAIVGDVDSLTDQINIVTG